MQRSEGEGRGQRRNGTRRHKLLEESSNGIGHGVVFASHCPSGNSGCAEFCSFACCQCAVLGQFMGRAPAATAAAIQSLCAAAVQFLWGLLGGSPMGLRGLSSARKVLLPPPEGTA